MVLPEVGSVALGATSHSGANTNSRSLNRGCGIWHPSLLITKSSNKTMSISAVRSLYPEPSFLCVRPSICSMRCVRYRTCCQGSVVSTATAALLNLLGELKPTGAVLCVRDCAVTLPTCWLISSTIRSILAAVSPKLEPKASKTVAIKLTENEHSVAVGTKMVFLLHGYFIGIHHLFVVSKGGSHH